MTLKEFCEKYQYAESTVRHAFPQVQRSILNTYGVQIVKTGRGKKAIFTEIEKSEEDQMKDLREFLEKNPMVKEYFEGLEGQESKHEQNEYKY